LGFLFVHPCWGFGWLFLGFETGGGLEFSL